MIKSKIMNKFLSSIKNAFLSGFCSLIFVWCNPAQAQKAMELLSPTGFQSTVPKPQFPKNK
jgi:hypothetical protein